MKLGDALLVRPAVPGEASLGLFQEVDDPPSFQT